METTANLSIFLVDDDKMFLTSMAHQLKQYLKSSAQIKTFPTGEECLKNLNPGKNVVVLDYYLNSQARDAMNGVEVLKKIKQVNPEAEVIMVSAQDKMEVAIDVMKHGAYDYVIKNDNAFLRTQNAIKNASRSMSVSRELKDYKFWVNIFLILIALIVAITIHMRIVYPRLF